MSPHSRSKWPLRSLLAAALAVATTPAFAQQSTFSQTVFFGDSLTDAGFFRPLLPSSVRPVTGQFTTNPGFVWSQHLADYYGTSANPNGNGQFGTNYAAGGARVGINTTGALGPIPSLATQFSNYLATNGGRADPNALYSVWGGANDIFAITNAGAPAGPTIASAVTSEVGIVTSLQNAGARYVLVANVPDIGLTPAFRALGPAAQANGTALSSTYNTSLFNSLAASNLRVIPLDSFNFLREVVANPAAYGFTNFTGTACQPQITANSLTCNPTSVVSADARDTYVFADGVHPTTGAHQILSQLAISVLEAPRQIAVLPYGTGVIGRARAESVASHVDGTEADGTRWWISGRLDDVDPRSDVNFGSENDNVGPAFTGGVDWIDGNMIYGVFAGIGRKNYSFGPTSGDYSQSDGTLGGFFGWYGDKTWVNAQLSYSFVSYDIDRAVQLGPVTRVHSGSPDGSNLSVGVNAGIQFGEDKLKHGPVINILAQRIDVDGFSESEPTLSSALAYPDQSFDSLIGSIGWQANYQTSERTRIYGKLTYDREFEDYAEEAFARSLSVPGTLDYAVPGLKFDEDYGTAVLGVRTKMFELDANIGISSTFSNDNAINTTVFATFSKDF